MQFKTSALKRSFYAVAERPRRAKLVSSGCFVKIPGTLVFMWFCLPVRAAWFVEGVLLRGGLRTDVKLTGGAG